MAPLVLAAAAWILIHRVVPRTVRARLVPRIGESAWRGAFALTSLAVMILMVQAYRHAPYVALWPPVPWAPWVAAPLVAAGLVLLVCGMSADNPTAGEPQRLVTDQSLPVHGITRVTRHPMMAGVALWAIAHILTNGHGAALVLFGTLLTTAIGGMASLDRKTCARVGPAVWEDFAARTSRLPFAAILAGRSPWRPDELPWSRIAVGLGLFAAALAAHPSVFGLPALPL